METKIRSQSAAKLILAGCLIVVVQVFFLFAGQNTLARSNIPVDSIIEETFKTSKGKLSALSLDNAQFISQEKAIYTFEIFPASFSFNGLGLRFRGDIPPQTSIRFLVRVEEEKGWTDWKEMELLRDAKEDIHNNVSEPVFFYNGKGLQYQVELATENPDQTPKLDQVEWIYFDTSKNAQQTFSLRQQALAENVFTVISRTKWGADESFRLNAEGKEIWPPKTAEVKKFIVHHTAGSSGGTDPQATIRGIYYWHAQVLGWGDIGYNYLIDGSGNIYEGRYGGEGVIGGHTFNSATNTNYNEGSIGIAILGCFETTSGACSTLNEYNQTLENALVKLIGNKAAFWKIDPQGENEWFGAVSPNIMGHRDVDQTYCPGSVVQEALPNIRNLIQEGIASDGNPVPEYRAEFISHDLREAHFLQTSQNIAVRFKNTGGETWGKHGTYLEIFNDGYTVSPYRDDSWQNEFGRIPFQEQEVKPGETATFIFTMRTPNEPGNSITIFRIKPNDHEALDGETSITTRADSHYQAFLESHNVPKAILNVWQPTVTLKIKNVGHAPWDRGLIAEIANKDWSSQESLITLKERTVANGQTGTFTFHLKPPKRAGTYPLTIRLRLKNNAMPVQYGTFTFSIRVDEGKK